MSAKFCVLFKLKKATLVFFITFFLLNVVKVNASGYRLLELGAKAATLAGAFVGRADNTSAIYYNPAGIAFQKGIGFRVNVNFFDIKHTAYDPEEDVTYRSAVDQLRGSLFVSWNFVNKVSIGIGYFQPYTMETDWPEGWPGETLCLSSKLNTDYLRPTLAFKFNDRLSFGIGLDLARVGTSWNYIRIFSLPQYEFVLKGDITQFKDKVITQLETSGHGIGFAAGVLWRPSDKIGVGIRYQHKVDMDMEGTTRFNITIPHTGHPTYQLHLLMKDFYTYEDVTSSMTMPAEFVMGLMVTPTKKLALHLDVNWTGWSDFKGMEFNTVISEEELRERFYKKHGDIYGIFPDWASQGIELNMKDVWSFKFGAEYFLKDVLAIRAGYSRSQSSLPDEYLNPILPVLPRNVISLGVGYDGPVRTVYDQKLMGALTFDAFVQYVMAGSRTSFLPGYEYTYDSAYWVIGCGVGLNL